jgi:hypothetical protein
MATHRRRIGMMRSQSALCWTFNFQASPKSASNNSHTAFMKDGLYVKQP